MQLGSRINSDRPALVVYTDTVAVKDNEVSHRQEKEGGSDRGEGERGGGRVEGGGALIFRSVCPSELETVALLNY